jgi:hypothetical protein
MNKPECSFFTHAGMKQFGIQARLICHHPAATRAFGAGRSPATARSAARFAIGESPNARERAKFSPLKLQQSLGITQRCDTFTHAGIQRH